VKRVTNLLHLLVGFALLTIAAYFFWQTARGGNVLWWQQLSGAAEPSNSAKSDSAGDLLLPGTGSANVNGVLSQHDEAPRGDDTVLTSSSTPSLLEHVYPLDAGEPNHFLHRRLSVETCQIFKFEVPSRAIRPELRGTFRSAATRRGPHSGGLVEILLMSEEEFLRFANNRAASAIFSSIPSSRGEVHWKLNADLSDPQKYYLVFRNSSQERSPSVVDADFTVSFE